MAKIRKDLTGSVLAVDEHNNFTSLRAGDEIPDGFFVGGHAVHKGDPRDQTPPWKQTTSSAVAPAASPEPVSTPPTTPTTPSTTTPESNAGGATTPVPIPPKSGTGSGIDAWRAYAVDAITRSGHHIDIPDDVKRDELIAALVDANIPTE